MHKHHVLRDSHDEDHRDQRIDKNIILAGPPNVGKSTLFYKMTKHYVWTANYPGTTFDLEYGYVKIDGDRLKVIDTPGANLLSPNEPANNIVYDIILSNRNNVVVLIVRAIELENDLAQVIHLVEELDRVILVVNGIDELEDRGYTIDIDTLSNFLGIPVVAISALKGEGIKELILTIEDLIKNNIPRTSRKEIVRLPESVKKDLNFLKKYVEEAGLNLSPKFIVMLELLGYMDKLRYTLGISNETYSLLKNAAENLNKKGTGHLLLRYQYREAKKLVEESILKTRPRSFKSMVLERIDSVLLHPVLGSIIAFLVLIFIYYFVGVFGAGIIVDYLESLFETYISEPLNTFFSNYTPYPIYALIAGEYGVVTLGVKYAFAIVIPIVFFFTIAISLLEDIGYLPRLSALLDRVFARMGLNGRAVIPFVLGLGCVTLATLSTRIVSDSRKQRALIILLLSLAIPCSAQQGVVFALLPSITSLLIWLFVIVSIMLVVGLIASKLYGVPRTGFIMRLPPLSIPSINTIAVKTYTRVKWYFVEVFPIFIIASVIIWIGDILGLFDVVIKLISVPVTTMGLPQEASPAFIYGFFRRDYGAAGLFDIRGLLTEQQLIVSSVVITLFVPCIAQASILAKTMGKKFALAVYILTISVAFTVGIVLSRFLMLLW